MMDLIISFLRNDALIDDIGVAEVEPGALAIWWLGQSGYAIKSQSALLYIDLYLSEHLTLKYANTDKPHIRMTEAPILGSEITNARLVLSSHKHSDHLDPATMLDLFRASPHARLLLPAALIDHAIGLGLDRERLIPSRGDETHQIDGITIQTIPSAHPGLDFDLAKGYPFLGFLVTMDGVRFYHSGDTICYDGLAERVSAFDPHFAFLPINGTDERRDRLHVPPNMGIAEAIAFAHDAQIPLTIPHHYDMFTFNTADVHDYEKAANAAGVRHAILKPSQQFTFRM